MAGWFVGGILIMVRHKWCKLTHWGRMTHICVSKLTIIGSDNGLPPDRRQAIIWTNAGMLSIGPLGTNLSEILIEIHAFSFKKMHLKTSAGKWPPFCLGLNVLTGHLMPKYHEEIPARQPLICIALKLSWVILYSSWNGVLQTIASIKTWRAGCKRSAVPCPSVVSSG